MEEQPQESSDVREVYLSDTAQAVDGEAGEEAPNTQNLAKLVSDVVRLIRGVYQSGDQVAMILTNPEIHPGFEDAFRALGDELLPVEFRDNVPIVPEPECTLVRIVTGTDVEMQYLHRYFGPRAQNGNGKLEKLQAYLANSPQPIPIRISLEVMRTLWVLDVLQRIDPGIVTAQAASPIAGIRR